MIRLFTFCLCALALVISMLMCYDIYHGNPLWVMLEGGCLFGILVAITLLVSETPIHPPKADYKKYRYNEEDNTDAKP